MDEYWDIFTGDALNDADLYERYNDMLDEVCGEVTIGSLSYMASDVLASVDPIAYRVGFSEFLDAELDATITDEMPSDYSMEV